MSSSSTQSSILWAVSHPTQRLSEKEVLHSYDLCGPVLSPGPGGAHFHSCGGTLVQGGQRDAREDRIPAADRHAMATGAGLGELNVALPTDCRENCARFKEKALRLLSTALLAQQRVCIWSVLVGAGTWLVTLIPRPMILLFSTKVFEVKEYRGS